MKSVTLVDLDQGMTDLARELPLLRELNESSLFDPRVRVVNDDAMVWITEDHPDIPKTFDVVIVDFPDPNNFALGKLYTVRFYRLLRERLAEGGVVVGAEHVTAGRASLVLVRRALDRGGGLRGASVPCARAVVRRVGLRPGGQGGAPAARRTCRRASST